MREFGLHSWRILELALCCTGRRRYTLVCPTDCLLDFLWRGIIGDVGSYHHLLAVYFRRDALDGHYCATGSTLRILMRPAPGGIKVCGVFGAFLPGYLR